MTLNRKHYNEFYNGSTREHNYLFIGMVYTYMYICMPYQFIARLYCGDFPEHGYKTDKSA